MQTTSPSRCIPGTTLFDADQARKGYALNKMCFSFNDKANRDAFLADTEGYMRQYAGVIGIGVVLLLAWFVVIRGIL